MFRDTQNVTQKEKTLKAIKKTDTLPFYRNVPGTVFETMIARKLIKFLQAAASALRCLPEEAHR